MSLICSRPSRSGRTHQCENETQDRPHLASKPAQTQDDEVTTATTSSGSEERYQPRSKLLRIPLDLTAVIFDLLEVPDAVAFSLTCKGIHHHLFANARGRLREANHEDHYQVQTMLEKNLPHDQIYCPFCKTFHCLDQNYRKKFCRERDDLDNHTFATFVPGYLTHSLKYLDARAIMNTVIFKRPGALQALTRLQQALDFRLLDFRDPWRDPTWHQIWEPKVIGGQLFLRIAARHVRMPAAKVEHEFSYSVCKHVHVHGKFPHMWVHNNAHLTRAYFFSTRRNFAATCRTCGTHWKLAMKWVGAKDEASKHEGWDVRFESWHCLGDVRSPFSRSWMDCAGKLRNPKPRWIEGTTDYIIDHDDWDRQMEAYEYADYSDDTIGLGPTRSFGFMLQSGVTTSRCRASRQGANRRRTSELEESISPNQTSIVRIGTGAGYITADFEASVAPPNELLLNAKISQSSITAPTGRFGASDWI